MYFRFLNLSRHRATVLRASEQATKGKIVFPAFALIAAVQNVLNTLEQFASDEGSVSSYIGIAAPFKLPNVKRILEHRVQIAPHESLAEFPS
jgi:hypothetical protein